MEKIKLLEGHFSDADTVTINKAIEAAYKSGYEELLTKESLEIGRKAIEDMLVEWRDSRLSEFNRGNGLVIREKDGRDSSIIRFGPETALRIGILAMKEAKLKDWGIV